jgi:hypothetical protein
VPDAKIIPLHRGARFVRSDNIRGAAPIPAADLRAIFEPRTHQLAAARPRETFPPATPESLKARHGLFDEAVDALADFAANCVEMPGTALVLLALGQWSIIIPAICWALCK